MSLGQLDVSSYIAQLQLNPDAVNGSNWYARTTIQHNRSTLKPGAKLPDDVTNGEVAQLLEVNALTSVAPKEQEQLPAINTGADAPNQQGVNNDGSAAGNNTPSELTPDQIEQQRLAREQAEREQAEANERARLEAERNGGQQ